MDDKLFGQEYGPEQEPKQEKELTPENIIEQAAAEPQSAPTQLQAAAEPQPAEPQPVLQEGFDFDKFFPPVDEITPAEQPPQPPVWRQPEPVSYFPQVNHVTSATAGFPPVKQSSNSGLKAALIVVSIISLLLVGALLMYAMGDIVPDLLGSNGSSTSSPEENPNAPDMNIVARPSDSSPIPSDGSELTPEQRAELVRPCVVGIVTYVQNITLQTHGQGSGVIMSEDGYIITNAHLLFLDERQTMVATRIKVVLHDGTEYEAEIKGIDVRTDLAVIKVAAKNLPYPEFGNSEDLKVGESVMAIGNPGGLDLAGSVTQGIISGLNRNIGGGYSTTFIQTDAAINPGNSGGPLVNKFGQVIGINSSKIVASAYEGLGFAIPITEAEPIISDLNRFGYVKDRVKIGIEYQVISDFTARINDIPVGISIQAIEKDADIGNQGVQIGDIITSMDNTPVSDGDSVAAILKTKKPGDKLKISIFRKGLTTGRDMNFDVTITLSEDRAEFR
ncbi:MAG: trypsin-like peptidase domain-containing protein [Oscillospiraceae bacterium]|nr:trypsin-like peptidase domain-containing protein [Oscillospiraceae bacterium]